MRAWIGPLALLAISCGSTTKTTTPTTGTTAVVENPIYVDFAPQSSVDGQKMVFLSRRDGFYRVYLYNETADPKLNALSKGIAVEPATDELETSLSNDGNWILTWRSGTEKNYLQFNSFDLTQQGTKDLALDARLRDLTVAPGGFTNFAYTERREGADSVHIHAFTPGASVAIANELALPGEYQPQFAAVGTDLYVFTRKTVNSNQVLIQYRKLSGGGTWDLQPDTLTLNRADADAPSATSALGLFYAKGLDPVRLKTKLGTFTSTVEGYQTQVGVSQEAVQFNAFAGTTVDFSSAIYRANQPVALGNISITPDGAYLLLTGYDAWFCKSSTQISNVMVLVSTADGKALPLIPTRNTGTAPWTGLRSELCSYYENGTIAQLEDFDLTAGNAQILSVTNNRVTLIYESKYTGDREIRRLSFDVSDWTAKTYAKPVFTDISANPK